MDWHHTVTKASVTVPPGHTANTDDIPGTLLGDPGRRPGLVDEGNLIRRLIEADQVAQFGLISMDHPWIPLREHRSPPRQASKRGQCGTRPACN